MWRRSLFHLSLFSLLLSFALPVAVLADERDSGEKSESAAAAKIDFVRDIQPILAKSCHSCHGGEMQEGGLRLHRKADALAGGDTGVAIIPGKSGESRLIQYVTGQNENETIMPPEGEGERLTGEQIALLRAWIDQGAPWPASADVADNRSKHWSFQPVIDPPLPTVKKQAWVRNGIDAFVLAKLEELGIEPSPEADRVTLIRRLSLDLLGLPPSPADVDEFVADTRPDAYERLVDRLLASPHYGERWGRHWLDLARYADSDGYEKDTARPFAWRWRNWVIDAINADMPFDQFTIEQLAGDLLPNATLDQKVATGFHRNTLINKEGGVDQEEFRVKATVDRVNTTSTVWLGLTMGCAQCHTHKYDPLVHREYYGMFAFFNSLSDQDIPAPLPEQLEKYATAKAAFDKEHAPLLTAVADYERNKLPAKLAAWEPTVSAGSTDWTVLEPTEMKSAGGATLKKQPDNSVLASGKNPDKETYTFTFQTKLAGLTGIRLEVLPDASLPAKGPGRVKHGNFVLSELRVTAKPASGEAKAVPVVLENASADFSQGKDGKEWPVAAAIDGNAETGWAVAPEFGKPHQAVFELREPLGSGDPLTLTVTLDHQYGQQHTIGRARISVTASPKPVRPTGLPDEVAQALRVAAANRTKEQRAAIVKYYRTVDPELAKLDAAVAEHAKKAPVDPGTTTKAQTFVELATPRQTHVLIRGDFLRKGAEVEPHTPAVLPELISDDTPNRLDLAKWLVDPKNPLTSRVTVNRFWQRYFGRGLVVTSDDFGTQGTPPSHPELLDWLASRFIEQDWSMKRLHKLIVTSAAYRQSSAARADLDERDPQNVYLARQGRFRVEAEIVRDLSLAASGLLNSDIGGPSVRPPQPAGISELTYANAAKWVESKGPDRYRRGMYTHFQRTSPYPMLMTFDAPDSNVCVVRRDRSNTPLQALTLLNDAVFFECAQSLGKRILSESSSASADKTAGVAERIRHGFQICLSREPTSAELDRLQRLYETFHATCQTDSEAAAKLAGSAVSVAGDKPSPAEVAEAAAWVALARTLLNLDEFVTRE